MTSFEIGNNLSIPLSIISNTVNIIMAILIQDTRRRIQKIEKDHHVPL